MNQNIISLLDDINILYNRKMNIGNLMAILNKPCQNNVLTMEIIKSQKFINIKSLTKSDLEKASYFEISNNGNCYYSAIGQALCPNIENQNDNSEIKGLRIKVANSSNDIRINNLTQELRNIVAEKTTDETVNLYAKIACLYAGSHNDIKKELRGLYDPGKRALLREDNSICSNIPIDFQYIKVEQMYEIYLSAIFDIFEYITDRNLKQNIINIIKKNTIDKIGLIYLDEESDLPIILDHFNIVILDIHKIDGKDEYNQIRFHKPEKINENTKFIIVTVEGNHTNLIYKNNYTLDDIPCEFLNLIKLK